ncbi:MAG: glycosyltransferase family 4 protein [Gammaproteobacteria bacterium]|nr:glycosyltransferase family 4 protein [Gammaproteobacteria bacterium]
MKIAVLGTRGIPHIQGGVETHCQELYPRLVELGCDVTLFTRKPYIQSGGLEYKGVKLKHLFTPKSKSLEAIVHTFLGVIHAYFLKPDILHIHAIGPSIMVPFAKLLGLRVIVTNHGPDYDRQKWGRMAKFVLRLGERLGTNHADKIIVISNTIKTILETKYNRNDCILIPNGVNIPHIASDSGYVESLGLQKNKYIIGVGRFVPEKGFHDLIEAYIQLDNTEYKLVLVGDADHETDYSRNLKKLAKLNNITLTGFIQGEKLNGIFSHARLFAMPSYHEGLPIALLEALSYNLDVLVSNIPANLEVELTKESYFRTGDIATLCQQIGKKLGNKEYTHDFQEIIKQKYNWQIIASQILNAYIDTLSINNQHPNQLL